MEPVITLTSDPFSLGEEVAEIAARSLGWPIVADEIFAAAAALSGEDRSRIEDAIRKPPGFLGMSATTRKRLLASLGAAITHAVEPGGVIYRGPAGHHFIHGISHVIRVKITGSVEDRGARLAAAKGVTPERGRKDLLAEDKRRFRSCREVFGEDCGDPVLYDLLLSTSETTAEEAAAEVVRAAKDKRYHAQTWSIGCMRDLALAWEIRSALAKLDPDLLVTVDDGAVQLRTRASDSPDSRVCQSMREIVMSLPGVHGVRVETSEDLFQGRGNLIR